MMRQTSTCFFFMFGDMNIWQTLTVEIEHGIPEILIFLQGLVAQFPPLFFSENRVTVLFEGQRRGGVLPKMHSSCS